jgi:hypothetical protein
LSVKNDIFAILSSIIIKKSVILDCFSRVIVLLYLNIVRGNEEATYD